MKPHPTHPHCADEYSKLTMMSESVGDVEAREWSLTRERMEKKKKMEMERKMDSRDDEAIRL